MFIYNGRTIFFTYFCLLSGVHDSHACVIHQMLCGSELCVSVRTHIEGFYKSVKDFSSNTELILAAGDLLSVG